jgi:ZIP family zinc transporter
VALIDAAGMAQAGRALAASLLAALASGVGGLAVVALPRLPRRAYDALLGFSAGVMLGAAALTLLLPALAQGSAAAVAVGAAGGGALILLLDRLVPHLEPHFSPHLPASGRRLSLLLISAMTLHNLPEGLSVGVAYGTGEARFGIIVAIAIAAQNVPEGMAVAAPLRAHGSSRTAAFLWSLGSALVEPLAAGIGFHFVSQVRSLVPLGLAAAAGAMIFVASDQLIPECRNRPEDKAPTLALLGGFVGVGLLMQWLG